MIVLATLPELMLSRLHVVLALDALWEQRFSDLECCPGANH